MAEKKKIPFYLTFIGLHTRDFRPTQSMDMAQTRTAPDGTKHARFISTMLKNGDPVDTPSGSFSINIKLPPDLQAQIDSGEAELEIYVPEGGLYVYAGRDLVEKAEQLRQKERRELIHTSQKFEERYSKE